MIYLSTVVSSFKCKWPGTLVAVAEPSAVFNIKYSSNNPLISNYAVRQTKRNVWSIFNILVQNQVISTIIPSHYNLKVKTWNMEPTRKAANMTKNKLCMTWSPSKRQNTNGFSNDVEMRQSQLEIQHQESCKRYVLEGEEY